MKDVTPNIKLSFDKIIALRKLAVFLEGGELQSTAGFDEVIHAAFVKCELARDSIASSGGYDALTVNDWLSGHNIPEKPEFRRCVYRRIRSAIIKLLESSNARVPCLREPRINHPGLP
jgi:hypothetical protein